MISDINIDFSKHVARDDEGEYQREGGGGQLPGPELALEEQRHKWQGGGDEGTDDVEALTRHYPRHKTAHAAQQTQEGEETRLEEAWDACQETADTTSDTDEEPYVKRVAIGLADFLLILEDIHTVAAKEDGSYGNAHPDKIAPVFFDNEDGGKFQ